MIMTCHQFKSDVSRLSSSEEEYLEAIYRRQTEAGEQAKVKDLAKSLGVKEPSVVQMLNKLRNRGLVTYDRSGAMLTERGRDQAFKVVRRHKLAERLLCDVFGHELPGVHEHACELEHVLDDELTERIDAMLKKPATCPHGGAIPRTKDNSIHREGQSLVNLECGESGTVVTIPEERETVERLLALNILPGSRVKVVGKLPRGAVIVQCGKTEVALSREIASRIMVSRGRGGAGARCRRGRGWRA